MFSFVNYVIRLGLNSSKSAFFIIKWMFVRSLAIPIELVLLNPQFSFDWITHKNSFRDLLTQLVVSIWFFTPNPIVETNALPVICHRGHNLLEGTTKSNQNWDKRSIWKAMKRTIAKNCGKRFILSDFGEKTTSVTCKMKVASIMAVLQSPQDEEFGC